MSQLTSNPQVVGQDIYVASATQMHRLGEQISTGDGRKFRYASVEPSSSGVTGQPTGASLVAGNLIQASAQITNHQALVATAGSIGDAFVIATLGNTAAYVNQYAEGYAVISTSPSNGFSFAIVGHALVAALAAITANFVRGDSFLVAASSATRVDLQQNPYKGVLQMPTVASGAAVGVAPWALPSLTTGGATGQNFGWLQTHGCAAVLYETTTAVGKAVMPSVTTAGSVLTATAGTPLVGFCLSNGVTGKNNATFMTIDG